MPWWWSLGFGFWFTNLYFIQINAMKALMRRFLVDIDTPQTFVYKYNYIQALAQVTFQVTIQFQCVAHTWHVQMWPSMCAQVFSHGAHLCLFCLVQFHIGQKEKWGLACASQWHRHSLPEHMDWAVCIFSGPAFASSVCLCESGLSHLGTVSMVQCHVGDWKSGHWRVPSSVPSSASQCAF